MSEKEVKVIVNLPVSIADRLMEYVDQGEPLDDIAVWAFSLWLQTREKLGPEPHLDFDR